MPTFFTDRWDISYEIRFREGNHIKPHVHVSYKDYEALLAIETSEILNFPYANQLMRNDNSAFQNVEKHNTKVSWCGGQIDICVDRLVEDGRDLIIK